MKYKSMRIGLILFSMLCVVLLVGCVSKSKYETLQTNFETLQKELTDIKKIYPPHDFTSVKELQDWMSKNIQPGTKYLEDDFRSALKVQTAGIRDGYLISVMYDADSTNPNAGWIYNAALVNGVFYYWDPSNTDIYEDYKWLTE